LDCGGKRSATPLWDGAEWRSWQTANHAPVHHSLGEGGNHAKGICRKKE
jgi:hypothetical protein